MQDDKKVQARKDKMKDYIEYLKVQKQQKEAQAKCLKDIEMK